MVSGHVLVLGLARDWGLGFGEYFSVLWFLVICRGGDSSQAASLQGTIITSVSMLCSRWVSKVVTSRGTESVVVAEKRQTERAREGCMYVCMYVYIYIYIYGNGHHNRYSEPETVRQRRNTTSPQREREKETQRVREMQSEGERDKRSTSSRRANVSLITRGER